MTIRFSVDEQRHSAFLSFLTVGRLRKRQSRWVILVCLAILFSSLALRADASLAIYLYSSNGTPVDVTSSCSYQQHYVYDSLNNTVGSVDDSGRIFNSAGQQIGYIASIADKVAFGFTMK